MRQYKLKKCKRVHGIHFSPDGTRLLAVGGDEVRMVDCAVWLDLATGEIAGRIDQFANCYAVDPRVTRYVLGGARTWGLAEVQWTPLAGSVQWEAFPSPARVNIGGLAFDPTGELLAMATDGSAARERLRVVGFKSGAVAGEIELEDATQQVLAFNAEATRIAVTGGVDGGTTASAYDVSARTRLFEFTPPGTVTRCVLFLPDDRLVVANARNVYVLPPDGGKPLLTLAGHPKQVNAVTLTPDGRRLLTASHDGSIRTWDANTGEPGPAFDWGIGPVTAVAFAPDGLTCAAAGLNGKVVVWDVDA